MELRRGRTTVECVFLSGGVVDGHILTKFRHQRRSLNDLLATTISSKGVSGRRKFLDSGELMRPLLVSRYYRAAQRCLQGNVVDQRKFTRPREPLAGTFAR